MFKLESYITPIILSYVNRYIKNFKPEDSQVSLWGGDASFHNLELNLEVLEQELQLPFSFVSGSIRELTIHVPWTKIASEPIKITINTIECILNLKGKNSRRTPRKKAKEKVAPQNKQVEAPPGYIQSLINKIVSNISIHCNNLILKYVEEDIVLSMNVKLLKFESANKKWKPAYTDVSPTEVILRKVISINDLTLCLDKRNASGKIEVYQEPMLYRCSMTMHLLKHYHSATANVASTTRLGIYCNNMEFSMTEQQVPMLMRLLMLLYALQQKQLKPEVVASAEGLAGSSENRSENPETTETWTGWAWSYVSSVLPAPWEAESDESQLQDQRGHTLDLGFYVDRASVTFKVSEFNSERGGYYAQKKLRYHPMLTLDLQGIYGNTVVHGFRWLNCTGGVSEATLIPAGPCSCGYAEANDSAAPYLKMGSASNFHKLDSLFDAHAVENRGGKRQYNFSVDYHMATATESVLLEKTPAFAFDYVYHMDLPSDTSSDILSEFGSNYEFSNLCESSALRLCIGPFRLRICSGLIHRCDTIRMAASFYDYPPYYTPQADLPLQDLLPPSAEDFDALSEFIPTRTMRITFFAPSVELELMDHPFFEPNKVCLFRRSKKISVPGMSASVSAVPKITIECQFIDISQQVPMYVNRLVHTTCQLPDPPMKLFDACYVNMNIKVVGLFSRLVTNSTCHSIILTPSSLSYSTKCVLQPQYWINSNIPHEEVLFESENVTLNATKAKMLVACNIIERALAKEADPVGKGIYSSSVLIDACKDFGLPYMEMSVDGIRFKRVTTNSTDTLDVSVEAVKAFIFESVDPKSAARTDDMQQILFLSGPEMKFSADGQEKDRSEVPPLLTATIQFPLRPDLQKHPPILIFNLQEIRICVDPLLCKWLLYVPKSFINSDIIEAAKTISVSEASGSLAETPRRLSTHRIESVHSSSDKEQRKAPQKISAENATTKEPVVDWQEKLYMLLRTWFDVWKGMYLYGDVSQCTVYFPMCSLSAIGSRGIQEAIEQAASKTNPPDILVITLPFANIRSAQSQNISKYLSKLPVSLPDNIWTPDKSSFPWSMSISELSCFTVQNGEKLTFLQPVSLSATVGLSTRPSRNHPKNAGSDNQTEDETTVDSKMDMLPLPQKRKGSRNTNVSVTSSTNAQYDQSNSGSTPNSPGSHKQGARKKTESQQQSPGVSAASKFDISYLGVCVHIDTTPILISTSEAQVYMFASILYGLMEVTANLFPACGPKIGSSKGYSTQDLPPSVLTRESSTLSPTLLRECVIDDASDKTPPVDSAVVSEDSTETESVKLTAWLQWTITRCTIELLSTENNESKYDYVNETTPHLKLVIDAEDIVSSLDFQSVYLKVKSKVGSASIQHYERTSPTSKWQPGAFSGIVMRLRDDLISNQRHDENSLISVTITRASCQHTHTLWGAVQKRNKADNSKRQSSIQIMSKSRYITEIVVNVQPLDFIVSLDTLRSFYLVLIPLVNIPVAPSSPGKLASSSNAGVSFLQTLNNQTLPLAYLDCQDIRVIMPSKRLLGSDTFHDVLVVQLQKISLNPQAINPICRTPIRSDIYDQAAHARILNIPGSEVEDRQYQLDIIGVSVCTSTWDEISHMLSPNRDALSNLRGSSENPALEWNILERGQPNMTPSLNLKCVLEKFDFTIVAAPSMVYKDNTTICGHAIEMNLVTDILVNLSLQQIKLLSAILTEFVLLVTPLIMEDGVFKRPQIKFPYSRFGSISENSDGETARGPSKDSGFDTSDVRSNHSSKTPGAHLPPQDADRPSIFPRPPNTVPYVYSSVPVEVVLTAGKVGLSLYSVDDERSSGPRHKGRKKRASKRASDDLGYEASEESTDDKSDLFKRHAPLFFVSFTQPNVYFCKQQLGRKLQISCFDVALRLSGPEYSLVSHIPLEQDFPVNLLETRAGTPNPATGIYPAFFTLKFIQGVGKTSKVELDILKPTKILCQMSKWNQLLTIKDKVVDAFNSGGGTDSFMALLSATNALRKSEIASNRIAKAGESFSKFQRIRDVLGNTNAIHAKFDQLILAVQSESGHELHVGMRELRAQLALSTRPEKICVTATFDCITLTVLFDNFKKLLLNPWTVTFDVCMFWESWQDSDSDPQVQVTGRSDCILVDVSAEQLRCLEMVIKDLSEFKAALPVAQKRSLVVGASDQKSVVDKDQHYKDDLRAGAFQFVDSNAETNDELPLPYQVMFWVKNITAMAWRYPQPRALTKVRVFPVPYKMALASSSQEKISILCHLEYWSECRNGYLPYTQFHLSESEICHLNLPQGCPRAVVASTWRVVITAVDEDTGEPLLRKGGVSPRALAACMRIDSYFNKCLIPDLNVALAVDTLEVALYNYFAKDVRVKLPECLKKFTPDLGFPENQKFLSVTFDNVSAYLSSWNFQSLTTEFSSSIHSNVLDYAYLTEQTLVEPFSSKLELCMANELQCNFVSKPIRLRMGPSIAHTLAVSTQMWTQNDEAELDFIVTSRLVVCNDTNSCVRFGQDGTDESVLLLSRGFSLYSWRSQKKKQRLRMCVEESEWAWSKPFAVFKEGTQMVHFNSDRNFTIFITVKDVSKTQKQITFFGQLVMCNMLSEHFEMKAVDAAPANKEQAFRNAPNHILASRSAAPSIFINNCKEYFLRLRFYGLESSWTGDIPLREHATGRQPWLVKVPLQERGQFLSVWCRIFVQDFVRSKRILVMIWPLFMIRSNLPVDAKVHIETPTLGVHLDTVVTGKGVLQQLYCPGTIDHSHQITFQMEEGNSSANSPYVPLNYTLVDQQEFFKKLPKEDIEVVLESLNHCFESKWPYGDGELFSDIDWTTDDAQPMTHVQVKYQNAAPFSCALLVELMPWCLVANTLGTPVALMFNGLELCRIPHRGIVAPARLEENFHMGVSTGNNWFFSGPLQLAKSDWSQSFYMPKIAGNIPIEGNIKTCVKCDSHLCMLSITSSMANEIRLLRLGSTHVLSNRLSTQVHVVCLAVPNARTLYDFPEDADRFCFAVAPHPQKGNSGIPIVQWYMLKTETEVFGGTTDHALYVAFSVDPASDGWSCPIRVDKSTVRKAFAMRNRKLSMPVVLVAQEVKGQTYLALHHDPRPQLFIDNKTNVAFRCGQTSPDDGGVAKEAEHFGWNCKIDAYAAVYYNMPVLSEKFPELPQMYFAEKMSLACDCLAENDSVLEWSAGVSVVNNNDLFVRVPYYGDVKLTIVNSACITFVVIESVSQLEISARDIRVRLSMTESEKFDDVYRAHKELETFLKQTTYDATDDGSLSSPSAMSSANLSFQILPSGSDQSNVASRCLSPEESVKLLIDSSKVDSLLTPTLPLPSQWDCLKVHVFIEGVGITLITDTQEEEDERWELASLSCDDLAIVAKQTEHLKVKVSLADVQLDNQYYTRESYDFPVVFVGQDKKPVRKLNILSVPMAAVLENCDDNALVMAEFILESWRDEICDKTYAGTRTFKLFINPISCFVEDIYVTRLMQYMRHLSIIDLVIWPTRSPANRPGSNFVSINVPELVSWQCSILSRPLTIRTFVMSPISMLLSVHSSVKIYIALDQSPLQFGKFERRRVFTTSYRLGHALTMHYLSGAIFGAGWVVSSLELLGSPGGLARAMGTGLRDFVSLPYRGIVEGPMAFLKGITTGSASLMKHVTAGTLQSVTKLASSVARNLDRLTLDEEHQRRTEEQRRQRPQGVAQGFMQGMTSFGISLLGAIGGIAHHPLQSMMNAGPSPRSLATGVGLGLVGVLTKPLSGAAELVALTGQGLLQGAGWNPLPDLRNRPRTIALRLSNNSNLKYVWKFIEALNTQILCVADATCVTAASEFCAVALILTVDSVVIVDLESDDVSKILPLNDEVEATSCGGGSVLSLKHRVSKSEDRDKEKAVDDELATVMDPVMRARVAAYIRTTFGLSSPPEEASTSPGIGEDEQGDDDASTMNFYMTAQKMRYFKCLFGLAKQQKGASHFSVL